MLLKHLRLAPVVDVRVVEADSRCSCAGNQTPSPGLGVPVQNAAEEVEQIVEEGVGSLAAATRDGLLERPRILRLKLLHSGRRWI